MTRRIRNALICAALAPAALTSLAVPGLALAQNASAQNAPTIPACITRVESRSVVAYLMPDLIDSVGAHCRSMLDSTAFLPRNATRLSERMTPLSQRSWPVAKQALERQSGTVLPNNDFILTLGRKAITDGIADGMDRHACEIVDQMLGHLEPLPPQNLSDVVALFLEAGLNDAPDSPLRVCQAPRP